jgi:hypothetical protein
MRIFRLLLLACSFVGCSRNGDYYVEGQGQADRDLASGQTNVAFLDGVSIHAYGSYTELLRTKYHIGVTSFSLPAHPTWAKAWVLGYNDITVQAIERKFGTNFLKKVLAGAESVGKNDSEIIPSTPLRRD